MMVRVGLADFRGEVRSLLFDVGTTVGNVTTYTYTDAKIDAGVKAAWERLVSMSGVAKYGADGRLRDVDFSAANVTWDMEAKWRRGLEYYAAAHCLEGNIKDAVNMELAQALYAKADAIFR